MSKQLGLCVLVGVALIGLGSFSNDYSAMILGIFCLCWAMFVITSGLEGK